MTKKNNLKKKKESTLTLAQEIYNVIKDVKSIVLITNYSPIKQKSLDRITVIANISNDKTQLVKTILKIAINELGEQVAFTNSKGNYILLNPNGKAICFSDHSHKSILC